jgi:hypothetical protein
MRAAPVGGAVLDAIVDEGGRKFLILYERVRTRYHPYAGDPEAFF